MEHFKIGQIVVLRNNNCMAAAKGANAKITSINKDTIGVEWIDELRNEQKNGIYNKEIFIKKIYFQKNIKKEIQKLLFDLYLYLDENEFELNNEGIELKEKIKKNIFFK